MYKQGPPPTPLPLLILLLPSSSLSPPPPRLPLLSCSSLPLVSDPCPLLFVLYFRFTFSHLIPASCVRVGMRVCLRDQAREMVSWLPREAVGVVGSIELGGSACLVRWDDFTSELLLTSLNSWTFQRRTLLCRTGYKGVFELELVGASANKFVRREEESVASTRSAAAAGDLKASPPPSSSKPSRCYFSVRPLFGRLLLTCML
eukprot:766305-Hanusia_phi.AAC.7